jgi:Zn-dependent protease
MPANMQRSIRLFRLLGIDVYLHWAWFLIAIYQIQARDARYSSIFWNVLEYLALFLIVLLHEFGHALACRQVGGQANQIVLWPLGGIAYVSPPQRPGAMLWSIAAGPLVNVVLFPILSIILLVGRGTDWSTANPNAEAFFLALWFINLFILAFNLLPIYPLDGGQILRSLLWFLLGRTRSLLVVAIIGFAGVGCLLLAAFFGKSIWLAVIAVFVLLNCWKALTHARTWARLAKAPRREGFVCPSCRTPAPQGTFWVCSNCKKPFDTFETNATCPNCRMTFSITTCPECSTATPISIWSTAHVGVSPNMDG